MSLAHQASSFFESSSSPSSADTVSHAQGDDDQHLNELVVPSRSKAFNVRPKAKKGPESAYSKRTGAKCGSFPKRNSRKPPKTLAEKAADRKRQRNTKEEAKHIIQPIAVNDLVVESIATTRGSSEEWKTLSEFYAKLWQKVKGTSALTSRCKHDDLNHSGQMSKLELHRLVEKAAARPDPDVAVPHLNQLRDALKQPFDLILVRAPEGFQREYGISDLLDSWGDDQFCQGFAPQSATSAKNATRKFACPQIKRIFLQSAPTDLGSNFLDLENRSGITFCSQAIDKIDLVKLIVDQGRYEPRNLARQEGFDSSCPNQELLLHEWVIVTKGPSASYFHVDAAGQATCIFGIQGSKTWCVPRGPWDAVCSEFQAGGTAYTKWSKGIRAVSVEEGTTIFQAPGTVHAVLTPDDCLVAGRFFYTAQLFAKSIKFMERFFQGAIYGNDDMKESDYLRLQMIINKVHDERFFNSQQRREVWQATHELLHSLDWKPKVDDNPKKPHGKRQKAPSMVPLQAFQNQQLVGELDNFEWPGENYIKHLDSKMPNFGSAAEMGFGEARNQFLSSCVSLWAKFVNDYRD